MSKKSKAEERAAKAAAALAERKRKERRRNLLTIGAVVLAIGRDRRRRVPDQPGPRREGGRAGRGRPSTYEVSIGDEDAPHEIVIYEDFLCPICQGVRGGHPRPARRARRRGQGPGQLPAVQPVLPGRRPAQGLLGRGRRGVRRGAGHLRARRGQEVPRPALREPAGGGRAVPERRRPREAGGPGRRHRGRRPRGHRERRRGRLGREGDRRRRGPRHQQHADDLPRRQRVPRRPDDGGAGRQSGCGGAAETVARSGA